MFLPINPPAKIAGFLVPPRGVEQPPKANGKSQKYCEGGAKSGARGAAWHHQRHPGNSERDMNFKNLPAELKKLIATLLRPYKQTRCFWFPLEQVLKGPQPLDKRRQLLRCERIKEFRDAHGRVLQRLPHRSSGS